MEPGKITAPLLKRGGRSGDEVQDALDVVVGVKFRRVGDGVVAFEGAGC